MFSRIGARIMRIYANRGAFKAYCILSGGSGGSLGARYTWKKIKNVYVKTPQKTPCNPPQTEETAGNHIKWAIGACKSLEITPPRPPSRFWAGAGM